MVPIQGSVFLKPYSLAKKDQGDDLVLIEYKSKSAPGTYRIGRVKEVEVDEDLLVRTCTVTYKLVKPSARNSRDIFKDITTKKVRVPVQRLILILPVEEQ